MLYVKDVSIYLKKDNKKIIENLNFSLDEGDKIAIIGKEGNGKSTLLKAIYNKELIKDFAEIDGKVFNKNEIIFYLPQDLNDDMFIDKSAKELLHNFIPYEMFDYNLYFKYLNYFDLDYDLIENNSNFSKLSGGEKIKLMLVIGMMKNPTLILLDEPSNDLDIFSKETLKNFINSMHTPILFISHDVNLLKNTANGIVHLEILPNGSTRNTVEKIPYEEYVEKRDNLIYRQTKQAKKEKEEFDKQMEVFRMVKDKVQHRLRNTKAAPVGKNLKDKMRTIKSMEKRFDNKKSSMTKIPILENEIKLNFSNEVGLYNKKEIIDLNIEKLEIQGNTLSKDISLNIKAKDKICIIGKNGSGKSTLLKLIVKNLEDAGVKYFYMPQNYKEEIDLEISPIEFLSIKYDKDEFTKIGTSLGALGYDREEMLRPISTLSGGQICELYFTKMVLGDYDFLILDEPTRNLSPLSLNKIQRSLGQFNGGILAVSHDEEFIKLVFDQVYQLNEKGLELVNF